MREISTVISNALVMSSCTINKVRYCKNTANLVYSLAVIYLWEYINLDPLSWTVLQKLAANEKWLGF